MTHWWQWPDSIFSFPGSFCQDSSPTQLHALTYVLLLLLIVVIMYSQVFYVKHLFNGNSPAYSLHYNYMQHLVLFVFIAIHKFIHGPA